jgi:DNA-binding NarL/FixJ family response regulator
LAPRLTAREAAVAHLVAQGLSNQDVAAQLVVSVKTVEYHLGHVYAKLGVRSRTQLAAWVTGGSHSSPS